MLRYPIKFLNAISTTLDHEGGYVNDPDDPGGETKYGITKRQYPDLEIISLSRDDAIHIYFEDFWSQHGYALIEDEQVSGKIFDLGVNMGPRNAHMCLQRACRACNASVVEDGLLGPETFEAVNKTPPIAILAAFRSEAAGYYRRLVTKNKTLRKYLKGWLNRAYS